MEELVVPVGAALGHRQQRAGGAGEGGQGDGEVGSGGVYPACSLYTYSQPCQQEKENSR